MNKRCVLLLDQNKQLACECKESLEDKGYKVEVAENHEHAKLILELAPAFPDFLVVDLTHEESEGTAFLNYLSQEQRATSIPTVLLTGLHKAVFGPMDEIRLLHKPFKMSDLLSELHSLRTNGK